MILLLIYCAIFQKYVKKRDLKTYSDILHKIRAIIENDGFIFRHLNYLYNILLDKNIF